MTVTISSWKLCVPLSSLVTFNLYFLTSVSKYPTLTCCWAAENNAHKWYTRTHTHVCAHAHLHKVKLCQVVTLTSETLGCLGIKSQCWPFTWSRAGRWGCSMPQGDSGGIQSPTWLHLLSRHEQQLDIHFPKCPLILWPSGLLPYS